jgi:hypothetical protein
MCVVLCLSRACLGKMIVFSIKKQLRSKETLFFAQRVSSITRSGSERCVTRPAYIYMNGCVLFLGYFLCVCPEPGLVT